MDESMYDFLPVEEAIVRAWGNLGPCDQYHITMQQVVREAMPLLGRALDRAVQEKKDKGMKEKGSIFEIQRQEGNLTLIALPGDDLTVEVTTYELSYIELSREEARKIGEKMIKWSRDGEL